MSFTTNSANSFSIVSTAGTEPAQPVSTAASPSSSDGGSDNANSGDEQPISSVPVIPVFLVAGLFVAVCIIVVAWKRLRANQILLMRMRLAAQDRHLMGSFGSAGDGAEHYDEYGRMRRPVLWDVWAPMASRGSQWTRKGEVGTWSNVLVSSFIRPFVAQ